MLQIQSLQCHKGLSMIYLMKNPLICELLKLIFSSNRVHLPYTWPMRLRFALG
ncbi:hypothetical protein SLEP1_g46250 [Rubroshorea leprosula]|uniref:Uncharacterized protein n=1 Tax=Rubroshorea leprosula TaxID=152421 RepID=A0AAV5LNE6_9ROSI|nr:hypothetical protein SLEP1_g46250 [Rubroshorea leprosula]